MFKTLDYNGRIIRIPDPSTINFDTDFHEVIYGRLFESVDGHSYEPYLDVDRLAAGELGVDVVDLARRSGVQVSGPSPRATNRDRLIVQHYIRHFLTSFPEFVGLVCNTVLLADHSIRNAEFLLGERCDAKNFIAIKQIIDDVNRKSWTRDKDVSERQSGVSTLGTISEKLLETVFESMVNDVDFFKVNNSQVQSYGDFVLMCLPNNLWISVKSNFARERLLASGYSNDILGVGFFESFGEFIGQVRIRNFQRAGFLAMYCPDVPVTELQVSGRTSTYQQILEYHSSNGSEMPRNINGKPFIRPLSRLSDDLGALLNESDIRRRFTVEF